MSGLSKHLQDNGIEVMFVCGLALDYCVKSTAIDAAKAGIKTFVIDDATKAVDQSEEGLKATKREMEEHGIRFVSSTSQEAVVYELYEQYPGSEAPRKSNGIH